MKNNFKRKVFTTLSSYQDQRRNDKTSEKTNVGYDKLRIDKY